MSEMRKRIMMVALSAVLSVNTIGAGFAQEVPVTDGLPIDEEAWEETGVCLEPAEESDSSETDLQLFGEFPFDAGNGEVIYSMQGGLVEEIEAEPGELTGDTDPAPDGLSDTADPAPDGMSDTADPAPDGLFDTADPAPDGLFDSADPVLNEMPDETDPVADGLFDEFGDQRSSEPESNVLQENEEEGETDNSNDKETSESLRADLSGEDSEGMIVMDGTEAETETEIEIAEEAEEAFILSACAEEQEEDDFFKDTEVIYDASTMEPFAGRTLEEVGERYADTFRVATVYKNADDETWYEEMCSLKSPYNAGKLAANTHEVMTKMQNYCRWLSGARPVIGESHHDENLQDQALDRNFYFGHIISASAKPKDMPWEMWEKGILCDHNVLASGSTPKQCILNWINEGYDASYDEWDLGHRHFMIGQKISGMCFGYSGYVGIGKAYSAGDNSVPSDQAFTAYPAPGYMPRHMIDAKESAWSVELNRSCVYYSSLSDVTVRVTNLDTEESYLCTQENGKLVYTDEMLGFIQPYSSSRSYGNARYQVDISGLKDRKTGRTAGITYQVNFVDIQETAPTRLSGITCACSGWYVPKALYNEEGLRMITAVLPRERVATARAENGATAGLPLAGEWTPVPEHEWFLGRADLTKLPANWEGDPGVENELRIALVKTGSVSNPLHFERDGQILSEDEPAVEGDEIRFVVSRGYKKYCRIVRISRSEDGSFQAETVFDTGAGDAFLEEGDNSVFTKTVTPEDDGDYVALISTTAWGTFYFPDAFVHLHVRRSPVDLGQLRISGIFSTPYTGSPVAVNVNIYDGDKKLVLNQDYTVQYENNVNAGTGLAVISGIGEYKGTVYRDLRITQAQIGKAQKEDIPDQIYDGTRKKPEFVLVFKGQELHEGTDYQAEYRNNLNPGTASIAVTGIGNFKGTRTLYFKIVEPETTDPSNGENDPADQPAPSGGSDPADQPTPSGGNDPADQPTPSSGNDPADQPAPSGGNSPADQPTPSGGSDPADQPAPSGGNDPADQPAPSGGNDPADQPAPTTGNPSTGQPTPPAGNPSTGRPASPAVNPQTGSTKAGNPAQLAVNSPEKQGNTPATVKPVLSGIHAERIVIPGKPVLRKAKAGRKGKVTITWKKFKKTKKTKAIWKQIKEIEVQYSTDPLFYKNIKTLKLGKKKTKLVIKGLQKNTYYVRMRYTDGTGGYSDWSSIRTVKLER